MNNSLPCFECENQCEAKGWIQLAYHLHKGGFKLGNLNLPCPKNRCTYTVDLSKTTRQKKLGGKQS